MTSYRAAPSMRCQCPARSFSDAQDAHQYARNAANAFQVGYVVFRVLAGRPVRLATYAPEPNGESKC
jgi:hypothetical protein